LILNKEAFVGRILDWYGHSKRDLPWRNTRDPYIIWLSEIILQQTRVAQGLPYFEKFLEKYPDVQSFASAPLDEILRMWQGLGYYSRARNMHICANQIVDQCNGEFPANSAELSKLKGIGSYTAAAIASFAFDEPVAVVDGNVFRVLSRYFGISEDINSTLGKKQFQALANTLIPKEHPGDYNQAIMEFGALQCVPVNPDCSTCPLQVGCFAYARNMVGDLPVKVNKTKIKERFFIYGHVMCGDYLVVKQRGEGDIWQGLHDFPLVETAQLPQKEWIESHVFAELREFGTLVVEDESHWFKHILTHQRIFASFVRFEISDVGFPALKSWTERNGFKLVHADQLESLGKPRLLLKYLNGEK
jgi:A/G-specific adenine glycosylase